MNLSGVPNKKTEGTLGEICINTITGEMYKCVYIYKTTVGNEIYYEYEWERYSDDSVSLIDYTVVNLYNRDSKDNMDNHYISTWDGVIKPSSSGNRVTHFIPVVEGQKYVINTSFYAVSKHGFTALYDKDKQNIPFSTTLRKDYMLIDYEEDTYTYRLIIPPGVAYIRVSIASRYIDKAMIVKGDDVPEKYIPYGPVAGLSEKGQELISDVVNEQMEDKLVSYSMKSPLIGKILAVDGDSMSSGAENSTSYADLIAERMNMTLQKNAVSGGTITAETYSNSGAARHWICRGIDTLREDADYIILQGGANDCANKVPLGEITDGYSKTLDDTTFCGAMESLCKQLYMRFHGKKVCFIMRHKASTTGYTSIDTTSGYYHKQKEILEKWGVPYIEMGLVNPPFRYIEGLEELYTTDGSHMSILGYEKYWVDKIIAFMESL